MRNFSIFRTSIQLFDEYPSASKLMLMFAVSAGGMVAYSESQTGKELQKFENKDIKPQKKKMVVLGTGWAGISFIKDLDPSTYDVKVVSPRNYFAFTPLLPSVTVGTVEARSIVEPIRNIIKKILEVRGGPFQPASSIDGCLDDEDENLISQIGTRPSAFIDSSRGSAVWVQFSQCLKSNELARSVLRSGEIKLCEAECTKIDLANKQILCKSTFENSPVPNREFALDYDYLIIAVGAQVNTFNTPGVMEHCHFLKEVEDAQKIRRTVIDCFEQADLPELSEEEKRKNLHFVVVGGGPTGVEFAAELHDFIVEDLVRLYPQAKELVKITVIQSGDHILNTFDERISMFAEKKFARDGIEVLTGCRVVSVSDDSITMKVKATGEVCAVPYGMIVWSTGVGTRPVVKDFMEQIGQGRRRVLATDEWLRVKGTEDVFALGDCASVDQRKIIDDIATIFAAVDVNKSGTLTLKEFKNVIDDVLVRYPQVELYLKSQHMDVTDLLRDSEGNEVEVDIEGFKSALSHVDSQMKSLPATAQVAAQQGAYLSRCFNHLEDCTTNPEGPRCFKGVGRHLFQPFRYRHLGQFAPLGGEQTAAELPGDWITMGHSSQWLWYSVYASKQVSWRTRTLVVGDWIKRFVFGRDSSRI